MEITLVIDRIEDNIAICENRYNKVIFEIDLSKLPEGSKEGTILKYLDGEYRIDEEEQLNIEQRIGQKMNDLWE